MKQETQKNKCSICDKRYVIPDRGGFSFMEVMISVFLLSIGMVASITLISGGLKESIDSRNQLIASLLAQEGVELVRNIRDNNWVQTPPADSFANFTGVTCRVDSVNNMVNGVNMMQCLGEPKVLKYNGQNYEHSNGANTRFYREIIISDGATADEKIVTSLVVWKGNTFPSSPYSTTCTTAAGCSYAEATLTSWSE